MRSIDRTSKAGLTLVELMVSLAMFTLLSTAIWANVMLQGRSFVYNRTSNLNVRDAGFLVNRMVYGSSARWGLRLASQNMTRVDPTGRVGTNGAIGWRAVVNHNVDDAAAPAMLDMVPTQTYEFDPVAMTITLNGVTLGENVIDSYFDLVGENIELGVQVEAEAGGAQTVMETRIRMRNL